MSRRSPPSAETPSAADRSISSSAAALTAPNPLTPADLDAINAALHWAAQGMEMLRREAGCGQNCQAHADILSEYIRKLNARKAAYFGGGI